jgi:hypothetical protein
MEGEVVGYTIPVATRIYNKLDSAGNSQAPVEARLEDGSRLLLVYAASSVTARSGTTLGTGTAVIQQISSSGVISNWTNPSGTTTTITIRNSTTNALSGGYMQVKREAISGVWLVDVASCS